MSRNLRQSSDPRTIAREVAGVFEAVFPQLIPGIVAHFNRTHSYSIKDCVSVQAEILNQSSLQKAMLFELAVIAAETFLTGETNVNWDACLDKACLNQQRYYDAQVPDELKAIDKDVALAVANNLASMLGSISDAQGKPVLIQPRIPGYRWIASGVGDFATNTSIIEVKCSSRRFGSADYRQIVIYWLLSYIEGLEKNLPFWTTGILLNPRLNFVVEFAFGDLIPLIAAQRSPIEIVETFRAIIDDSGAQDGPSMAWREPNANRNA